MKRVILGAALSITILTVVAGGLWLRRPGQPSPGPTDAAAPPPAKIAAPNETALPPAKFDVVRVNPQGQSVLAGRAAPNAEVSAFDGDISIGRAKADARGEWVIVPDAALPPGTHTLRLNAMTPGAQQKPGEDQVTVNVPAAATPAEAKVAAAPIPPLPGEPDKAVRENSLVVRPGSNLWRIARDTYGDGTRYTVIYGANRGQIDDPDLIYPGQIFTLPPKN
jgi:hypothetical protein